MSEPIVSTLTVSFDNNGTNENDRAGNHAITLEQLSKRFDSEGQLTARCFPAEGIEFVTSAGTLIIGEVRSQRMWEGLKFSNSDSTNLKYSGATNVVIDSSRSILLKKEQDRWGDTKIVPAEDVFLRYDADASAVIAESTVYSLSRPSFTKKVSVYGACFVSYEALYRILYYKPVVNAPFAGYGGVAFQIGTIFGYNNQDVATLDMELDLSGAKDWVEYARVTSKIVLDAKGTWEFPPNWESTYQGNKKLIGDQREDYQEPGRFPGYPHEIDESNSFVDTRVHHLVEVNSMGSLRNQDYNNGGDGYWAWHNPYYGSSSYDPVYEIKFADPPGGKKAGSADEFKYDLNHRTWRDVFLAVNKAEVMANLENQYPGLKKA